MAVKQILNEIGFGADFDVVVAESQASAVNEANELGERALYTAAEKGHLDIVKELLKYTDEETISMKNKSGFDPFHISAKQGHLGESMNFVKSFLEFVFYI